MGQSLRSQVWFRKRPPTRARIQGATIFVDAATDWFKVCLMQDETSKSTLEAKEAFECASAERGVIIKGYHADNRRYIRGTRI